MYINKYKYMYKYVKVYVYIYIYIYILWGGTQPQTSAREAPPGPASPRAPPRLVWASGVQGNVTRG